MNRYPSFKICFLSSYYLKWPGCFNGCRCGDECKVQGGQKARVLEYSSKSQMNGQGFSEIEKHIWVKMHYLVNT
nr:hypothetical protein CFP56_26595 [Quercus suber]